MDYTSGGKRVNTVSYADGMKAGAESHSSCAISPRHVPRSNDTAADSALTALRATYPYFGYGYYDDAADLVPPVALTFYAFHIMVLAGGYLLLLLCGRAAVCLPLAGYADEAVDAVGVHAEHSGGVGVQPGGWVCAEVGRQPWVIQDLMPTRAAISALSASSVQLTFWMFAVVFTVLLAAEMSIMVRQIVHNSEKTED